VSDAADAFWDFSLATYGAPGVEQACLALQDRRALDINLLLFCCWAGRHGRALTTEEIAGLMAAVADWQAEVVWPLRQARRWLKGRETSAGGRAESLRQSILACELEAERAAQALLCAALPLGSGAAAPEAAARNLAAYCDIEAIALDEADKAGLGVLLNAAFPELSAERAEALIRGLC